MKDTDTGLEDDLFFDFDLDAFLRENALAPDKTGQESTDTDARSRPKRAGSKSGRSTGRDTDEDADKESSPKTARSSTRSSSKDADARAGEDASPKTARSSTRSSSKDAGQKSSRSISKDADTDAEKDAKPRTRPKTSRVSSRSTSQDTDKATDKDIDLKADEDAFSADRTTTRTTTRATTRRPTRTSTRTADRASGSATDRTADRATGSTPTRASGSTPTRASGSATDRTADRTTGSTPTRTTGSATDRASGSTTRRTTKRAASRATDPAADLNATMSYEALGEDYPEIPLVEDGIAETGTFATGLTADSFTDEPDMGDDWQNTRTKPSASTKRTRTKSATASTSARASSRTPQLPVVEEAPRPARSKSKSAPSVTALADPQDFRQADLADNSYHIRGGGTRHNRREPLMVILIAVVVIAGIALSVVGFTKAFGSLMVEKTDEEAIVLTASETRSAIDEQMPDLLSYLPGNADDAWYRLKDLGENIAWDYRTTSYSSDASASGNEIIRLLPPIDQEVLEQGYYEGGFDAYDFNELQQYFNGAWVLDIEKGDKGTYLQVQYMNFASVSLDDELRHLGNLQGCFGDNSAIDIQGTDDHGNSYIRGYFVVEGVTYYWELIGITLEEYYGGQDRRTLPETAVFVKCKLADFDFYGAGEASPV